MVSEVPLKKNLPPNDHNSSGCGMWYQRIEEIVDPNNQSRAAPPRLPKTAEGFPQKVMQKRKLETSIAEDTVSCFKRVRLL